MNETAEAKRWDHETLIRFIPRFNELQEQAKGGVPACLDNDPLSDSPIWTLQRELRDSLREGSWISHFESDDIDEVGLACFHDPVMIDTLLEKDLGNLMYWHILKNKVCDGHFGMMVSSGQIGRMLEQVRKLGDSNGVL
jgi:hypothetical protein